MLLREFIQGIFEAADIDTVNKVRNAIQSAGGEVYTVGGAVRDEVLGISSKDIDFLVRNLEYQAIKQAILPIGKVVDQEVGGKVSMLKVVVDDEEFDIAIPRTEEKKTGDKHTEFDITLDPKASVEADLSRRDFTINALAKDAQGNIVDKFGGMDDLKNKVIRAVGNPEARFQEDPLRMLRALQFATRLGFDIEPETAQSIKKLLKLFETISPERILMEFAKAWTKGKADNNKLVHLLKDLGVGEALFGPNFDPMPVQISGDSEEKIVGSFVGFFLNGGDHARMRPNNKMLNYLSMAQKALAGDGQIWLWLKREAIPVLHQVFSQIGMAEIADRLKRADSLPLKSKELAVDGKTFMQLGLKGKQIGKAQQDILQAIHSGETPNEKEAIIQWLK